MWTKVRIRIVSHPRLLVGVVYEASRDENGNYYVEDLETGINETVWESEAEEVADGAAE